MNDKEKKLIMQKVAKGMAAAYAFDVKEKLTLVDLMVLSYLHANPGITMTEACKDSLFDAIPLTTVQYSFVSFAKMELIVKKPHPTDHKAKAVFLSRKGEQLVKEIAEQFK